jgi:hypothetical protein
MIHLKKENYFGICRQKKKNFTQKKNLLNLINTMSLTYKKLPRSKLLNNKKFPNTCKRKTNKDFPSSRTDLRTKNDPINLNQSFVRNMMLEFPL